MTENGRRVFERVGRAWRVRAQGHDEEIVAVLAHELGHWKLKHTVFNFAAMQLIVILQFTLFAVVRHTTALYVDFGFDSKPALISLLLFQHIISPVDHVVSLAFNLLSRHFEFQADAFACKLHHGPALRNGLIRLQEENKSSPNLDPWCATPNLPPQSPHAETRPRRRH